MTHDFNVLIVNLTLVHSMMLGSLCLDYTMVNKLTKKYKHLTHGTCVIKNIFLFHLISHTIIISSTSMWYAIYQSIKSDAPEKS